MRTLLNYTLCIAFIFCTTSYAKEWANSEGSCYGKQTKNISFGMSLLHIGFYGAFDYGFHDAISGGFASGYNGYSYSRYWRYNYIPIVVRAAFHPFNLNVLSDKIKIRDKLDAYVGVATGGRIGWAKWRDSGDEFDSPTGVGGFIFREYIGVRFFPAENFYISAEEGSGLGLFNIGVGFSF